MTDQSSHYALDGLLGGIVTPAGMSCNIFLYNILLNIALIYTYHNICYFVDEVCHLVRCGPGRTPEEGCGGNEKDVWSYADQLIRDYPSFGQIRKVVNENSKQIITIRLLSL